MARRSRARERKEERKQSERRSQQLVIAGIGVVVVIFGAIVFLLTSVPTEVELPEGLDRYENYMQGFTDEGYPRLGNPNAPVTVSEYSSFGCPGCGVFHDSVYPQLLPLIAEGRINFVYVPLTTGSIQNPDGAARTAICAGQQGQFWQMHDVLFHWADIYGNSAFQDSRLRASVGELGLDRGEFLSCFSSNATDTVMTAAFAEGIGTTPSVAVNGVLQPNTSFATIVEAIESNIAPGASFEPGLIAEEPATDEETTTEESTTEEDSMTDDPTSETTDEDVEMTEEATEPASDATTEAETTEEAE